MANAKRFVAWATGGRASGAVRYQAEPGTELNLCRHSNFSNDLKFLVGKVSVPVDPKSIAASLVGCCEAPTKIVNGPVTVCKCEDWRFTGRSLCLANFSLQGQRTARVRLVGFRIVIASTIDAYSSLPVYNSRSPPSFSNTCSRSRFVKLPNSLSCSNRTLVFIASNEYARRFAAAFA